jgi:MarR family transcriptional regulator, organic hydroperoxide resistance regulator
MTCTVPVTLSIRNEIRQQRPFPSPHQEAVVTLMRTADLARRVVGDVVEAHGITAQQYNVLRILRGAGNDGLPTLEIAERMIEQTPGITRLIDRLERKKLVTRERSSADRRCVYCRISEEGLGLLDRLDGPVQSAAAQCFDSFTKRALAQLVESLDRTRERMNQRFIERRRTE